MFEAPAISQESSISEVLEAYEAKGATVSFSARPGAEVQCGDCGAEEPAEQTPMLAMHRFEGNSNPSDEQVIAVLECAACGKWGTMTLHYGPGTSAEDGEVLSKLLDARDQSGIEPGQ